VDFGGRLRFGFAARGAGAVGEVFVYKRGFFEIAVFDRSHFGYEFAEDAVTLQGNDVGTVVFSFYRFSAENRRFWRIERIRPV
jgi:hypothetical protein